MINHHSFACNLFFQYVSFHISHSIPYFIVVFYIVRVENIHALGILTEWASVVFMLDFFSCIAQSAEETPKANESIIQEKLTED